jgi:hypothetical protein
MTLHIDDVEAFWLALNLLTLVLTLMALGEARRDLKAALLLQGDRQQARTVVARGNVRREVFRVVIQAALLSLVIPGLFVDRQTPLNAFVVTLITVPVLLLGSTLLDRRDRGRLAVLLAQVVVEQRNALALESSVQDVKTLTREGITHAQRASDQALRAYDEANHSNEKLAEVKQEIADLTRLVAGKDAVDTEGDTLPPR